MRTELSPRLTGYEYFSGTKTYFSHCIAALNGCPGFAAAELKLGFRAGQMPRCGASVATNRAH